MSSIVAIIRATIAGCWLKIEMDGNKPILLVAEANPAINVKDSRQLSQ